MRSKKEIILFENNSMINLRILNLTVLEYRNKIISKQIKYSNSY